MCMCVCVYVCIYIYTHDHMLYEVFCYTTWRITNITLNMMLLILIAINTNSY